MINIMQDSIYFKEKLNSIQKFYYIKYLMEDVRITFKHDYNMSMDNFNLDAKSGEITSIPRWVAKILVEENIAEIQDHDILVYVSRSLNRERIAKPHDISGIDNDFYIRVNDYMNELKENERENILVSLNSFVTSRIEKIVKLAAASSLSVDLKKKLSVEEIELYNFIHNFTYEFKQKAVKKF